MGLSLKKRLTDNFLTRGASRAFDQANVFDDGRSWQQRTPTVKQSVGGQVRNIFDANNKADVASRVSQGQPALYRDQQQLTRRDNVQSVEENPFKRVYQEAVEAPRRIGFGLARNTTQQAETDQSTLSYQQTRDNVLLNAQKKIKDPFTPVAERQRLVKYLQSEYPQAQQDDFNTRLELERNVKDADPVAGLAALAEMGVDVATLGMGGVVFKGSKQAAKQGFKQAAKYTAKNIIKPVVPAAVGGALGAVTSQGSDVTPQQIAMGAGAGATLAVAFPAVGTLVGTGSKAINAKIKPVEAFYDPKAKPKVTLKNSPKLDPLESLKQEAKQPEPRFERDIDTGKMKMQSSKPATKEKYSVANSDIVRTKSPGMNQDGFTVEDWGGKKRYVSLEGASPETQSKVRRAEAEYETARANSTGPVAPGTRGAVQIAKEKVDDAYSDAINDLKLGEYATTASGGRTFNSRYNEWLEAKYKDTSVDSTTIKDMNNNPQKYRSQFEAETATKSQPPKSPLANDAPQVGKTDPNNWRNAVDGQKFGKDPDTNANILSDKQSTMREIARVSRSDKELSDILDRAEALKKDGYLGDNANLAWDVQNNPGASGATKARASKLYKEITAPQGKAETLYHGSDKPITDMRLGEGMQGRGVYLTNNQDRAIMYGSKGADGVSRKPVVTKVTANIKNPIESTKVYTREMFGDTGDAKLNGMLDTAFDAYNGKLDGENLALQLRVGQDNSMLEKLGFDAYKSNTDTVVFNPKNVITENQPKSTPAPLTVEKNVAPNPEPLPVVKPKVELKAPDQIKAAQKQTLESIAEKPKVSIKKPVVPARTTDDAIREIAGLGGLDIGQSKVDLGVTNKFISAVTGGKLTNVRGANIARTLSDKAGEKINKATEANITGSGAPVANKARALFAGTGLTDETKQISRVRHGQFANIKDVVKKLNEKDVAVQAKYGDQAQEMLDRVMRDEAYTQRVYDSAPAKLESLPEDLQNLVKEKIAQNKIVNDLNYQTGVIDADIWSRGTKGEHIGRVFAIPKPEKNFIRESLNSMFEAQAGISRKDISKMSNELIDLLERDPVRAINLRMEMALRNKAITEAMDSYASRGFIKATPPNKSFIQMTGKRYGQYNGQYIERGMLEELTGNRIFDSGMVDSLDRFINAYKGSALGISDRLQKAFKTTLSPGTIVGNISSNPLMFNPGAGTNPLTQSYDMIRAAFKLGKGVSDADVYKARQLGVIGGDTGKLLTGSSSETLAMGKNSGNIVKRNLQKVMSKFGQIYGDIDDTAKLGLWTRLQKQGLDPQKAALEVAKFTQDYNNVGRVVTLIADTPVLGKPFARFSPELVRIIKNNATRAPHRMIAGVAGIAYIANKLSQDAGETEEERTAREGAVGQTQIPGTAWINELMGGPNKDVSLNFAIGDSSVNIARSVGLNFPIEPGVDPNRALVEQLLPVEIPTRKNSLGEDVFDWTKLVTSMTLRPIAEQVADRNFMGNQITDPTNKSYDSQGLEKKYTELPQDQQLKNRARSAAVSLLPWGNEADSLISAATGNETVLGKERTLPQALLRTVGIKAEKNDKETREKRVDTAEYFDTEKVREQDFLKNNKDLEQLYFEIFPKTKDREAGKKVSDQITPEKWAKIRGETSGRMFEHMKQEAINKNKTTDGKYPVDPIFQLPTKQQEKMVTELRARPTGEDIESEEILRATQSWYPEFEKAERTYHEKNSAYYDALGLPDTQNARAKAYAEIPFAEQPKLVKDYYSLKATDPEAAKAMFKSTNLSAEFDKYSLDRLRYINEKRKIEGYPPIDATTFNNVTFGYEDDESAVFNELKYGKGYGGYGSGNKDNTPTAAYTKVPQGEALSKVSFKSSSPEIRTKKSVKRRPRPKLQIKKSLV